MNRIILTILIFSCLLVSCDLQPKKFEANIPKEEPVQTDIENKNPKNHIVIEINSEGKLFIKGKEYGSVNDTSLLEKEVSKLLEINKKELAENNTAVFVKASRSLKYGHIKSLTDKLEELGAKPIGLQVVEK